MLCCFILLVLIPSKLLNDIISPPDYATKKMMSQLKRDLIIYYIDNKSYPVMEDDQSIPKAIYMSKGNIEKTTYFDPFKKDKSGSIRYYCKQTFKFWIIQSCGPDQDYDLNINIFMQIITSDPPDDFHVRFNDYVYDPTNGSTSSGDVLFFSPTNGPE